MTNTKMTQRTALEMAIKGMKELEMNQEAIAVLEKMILVKEKQSEKAKERRQAKAKENDEYITIITQAITEKSMTIDEMKELDGFENFSTQKITAMLSKIKKENELIVTIVDKKKSYKIEE